MGQSELVSLRSKSKGHLKGLGSTNANGQAEGITVNPPSSSRLKPESTSSADASDTKEVLGLSEEEFAIFIEESGEVIDNIGRVLVAFEENPGNPELMNELFRGFHTLKGIGGAVSFDAMARLSHATESVLDTMRQGSLELDSSVADLLYKAVDTLAAMQRDLVDMGRIPEETPAGLDDLCERLMAVTSGTHLATKSGTGRSGGPKKGKPGPRNSRLNVHTNPVGEAGPRDEERQSVGERNILNITVRPLADAEMPEIRMYQVLKTLRGIGVVSHSDPAPEVIENGMASVDGKGAAFTVVTLYDKEQLSSILQSIPDIHCEIQVAETLETRSAAKEDRAAPDSGHNQAAVSAKDLARTIRVSVDLLDNLMDLVGELVIDKTQLSSVFSSLADVPDVHEQAIRMATTLSHLGRTLDDLQERIMKARMLPLETLFRRFPRVVRDLAVKSQKRIRLEISGEQTELDRLLIEEIANPLLHIIRNAVDHGIESVEERVRTGKPPEGTIHLSARYEESYTLISVRDDGRGIEPEKILSAAIAKGLISRDLANKLSRDEMTGLIFLPGLSTSSEVTDISGRGVGLDVVKKNIEALNGTLEVKSEIGLMTEFILRVPLTLAIVRCLLVEVNGSPYAIPLNNIREVMRTHEDDFHHVWQYEHALVRGELLPVLRLSRILYNSNASSGEFGVIVQALGRQAMFVVDDLLGEQEVVMKSLGKYLGSLPGLLAASNLGDGRIVFVLDVPALLDERAASEPRHRESEVVRRH